MANTEGPAKLSNCSKAIYANLQKELWLLSTSTGVMAAAATADSFFFTQSCLILSSVIYTSHWTEYGQPSQVIRVVQLLEDAAANQTRGNRLRTNAQQH